MKTTMILAAFMILFSASSVSADSWSNFLIFRNADGLTLFQPVKPEVAPDMPPVIQPKCPQINESAIQKTSIIFEAIDLTDFTKPEEAEPLPFDPAKVLRSK